ncbi:MAG: hypothetical protein J0M29_02160 [Chitinophagales bacterium]|nr:hypothetical protein [Chitinophagales bacterium]
MVNKVFCYLLSLCCFVACTQAEPVKEQPTAPSGKPIVWEFTESLDLPEGAMKTDSAGAILMQAGAETDYFIEPGLRSGRKASRISGWAFNANLLLLL